MGRRQKSEPDLSARLWATVYCKGAGEKGGAAGDGGARASEDGRTGASDFQGKVRRGLARRLSARRASRAGASSRPRPPSAPAAARRPAPGRSRRAIPTR
ncbi:hypothetical protein CNMCM8686_001080 [Aspergillus fumigatus]|nr:hypothetical protein CNMCM8686_001080 [Aspergillus fumigatus]